MDPSRGQDTLKRNTTDHIGPPPQVCGAELRRMSPPYNSPYDREYLERTFRYHRPSEGLQQASRYEQLREYAKVFAGAIQREVPPSREREQALIHIEEAVMWANAGIARNEV